ncbi:MAG: hypothetical protein CVU38_07815 [Chloroflexi bacterium HGW-Chloroflexi-1]|nr:MAG: hypothetical protein CVU38_07815 [Chloroflexi bacterium HGW-Chloroflexi-1]
MNLLDQLSSRVGDRTAESNRQVAARCLEDSALLGQVAAGLTSQDATLLGDCAEVFTLVAEARPEWVAPYAGALLPVLPHKKTRVRREAAHALALTAALAPEILAPILPQLAEIVRTDGSIIVRDYTVDAIGNYAVSSAEAARAVYPLLCEALTAWDGKHAAHAIDGLCHVAAVVPDLADALRAIGKGYLQNRSGVVRKAARALVRASNGH